MGPIGICTWAIWLLRWWFCNYRPKLNKKPMRRFHKLGIISLPHLGSKKKIHLGGYNTSRLIQSLTFEIPKKVTKN